MSETQIEDIAERVAHKTAYTMLQSIGIDPDDKIKSQETMAAVRRFVGVVDDEEFKANMRYITEWRETVRVVKRRTLAGMALAFVVTVLTYFGINIKGG